MPERKVATLDSSPRRATLAAQLATQRAHYFVGRDHEQALFHEFAAADSPLTLWFIHGPGGSGKSALLSHLRDSAPGLPCLWLDARRVAPNPPAVTEAVAHAAGQESLSVFCARHARPLLLVDTWEYWQELTDWLRVQFLPQLPRNLGIVFAGRYPPGPEWRTDERWREYIDVTRLDDLSDQQCRLYLQRRNVSEAVAEKLTEMSCGNPLALAMAADAVADGSDLDLKVDAGQSVYDILLANFAREAQNAEQRLALDACAVAWQLDETLLARVLEREDVSALYRWLSGLSFIDRGPAGLYPHDIVREVLMQTMPRRAPDRYESIARTAVNWVVDRMEGQHGLTPAAAARVGTEGMYALREVAVVQYYLSAEGTDALYVDAVRSEADWRALADMTRRHEGEESCAWFEFWRRRYPENVTVIRGIAGDARAYVLRLDMERLAPEDRDADPLTRRLGQFIATRIQPQHDERVAFNRFWVNHDYAAYHSPEKTQMMIVASNYNMTTPDLRLTAQVFGTRTSSWPQQARAIGLHQVDEQAVTIGAHGYHIFYNDWLRESAMRYYRLFADRCIGFEQTLRGMAATPERPVHKSLDKENFRGAVLGALQRLHRPAALQDNPLLASATVAAAVRPGTDAAGRVQALIDLLKSTIIRMQDAADSLGVVLRCTYLDDARTQKDAAAVLNIPYSSYRRQLADARYALVSELWRREQAFLQE